MVHPQPPNPRGKALVEPQVVPPLHGYQVAEPLRRRGWRGKGVGVGEGRRRIEGERWKMRRGGGGGGGGGVEKEDDDDE